MTCFITLKLISRQKIDPSKIYLNVSKEILSVKGTTANLRVDSWICLLDLLYGLMLPSGNDAAIVIAENIGALLALKDR